MENGIVEFKTTIIINMIGRRRRKEGIENGNGIGEVRGRESK